MEQVQFDQLLEPSPMDCGHPGCYEPIEAFVPVEPGQGCGRGAADELGVCGRHLTARINSGPISWIRWVNGAVGN